MLSVALLLVLQASAQAPAAAPEDALAALTAAIDLAEPMARRNAANALAARKDVTLDQWLELARGFGSFASVEPGPRVERERLEVLGKIEETELHVYVPAGYDPAKRTPLMMAWHGTGATGVSAWPIWRYVADEIGMLVLAPGEAGSNEGYAFSERERAAALAALRWMRRRYHVDEERVFGSGISRGGHLAWDLALRRPDLCAAIAPMIGSPRFNLTGGQNNLRFLENVVTLPIRDLQGALDDPGVLTNLRSAFVRLDAWKATDAKLIEFPELGHDFRFDAVDWKAWLGAARRVTVPKRVVRTACEKGEARAFWVELTGFAKDVVEDLRPSVSAATWNGLDAEGRRKWLEREVEKHTARLEITMESPGVFTAKGTLVTGFRLLLSQEMYDRAKAVTVTFNGRKVEKRARTEARVLLQEFVERFDCSFLPVATIEVP